MRILFLGTPDFAAIPLEALAQDARYQVVGVVTQPDRPVGRSRELQRPPVKQAALRLGIPVLQPETLRDAKMDSGPILAQRRVPLPPDARNQPLTNALFSLGAELLVETLPQYAAGALVPTPQDDRQATYCRMLKKSDGVIDWSAPAERIERMTRAYDPWPGAQTTWRGQPLKILAERAHSDWSGAEPPGTLLPRPDGLWVATGVGALELLTVQPAGKRELAAQAWKQGLQNLAGA